MLAKSMAAAETSRLVKSNFAPCLRSFHFHGLLAPVSPPFFITNVRNSPSFPYVK
jgi:hypothetical protein